MTTSITVFHAKPEIFRDTSMLGLTSRVTGKTIHDLFVSGGTDNAPNYNRVARIETADIDTAYYLTNHIDSAWNENDDERVTVYGAGLPKRSSSIGDIFMIANSNADGSEAIEVFAAGMMGFEKIS